MNQLFFQTISSKKIRTRLTNQVLPFVACILALFQGFGTAARADGSALELSLEKCITIALENNRSIINAQNALRSTRLSLGTRMSDFDVKISPYAGGGITDGDESFNSGLRFTKDFYHGMQVSLSPYVSKSEDYASSLGLSLEIPLFRNFGTLVNTQQIASAEFSVRASERALIQTQESIILDTVSAFYDIVEQKKCGHEPGAGGKFQTAFTHCPDQNQCRTGPALDVYRAQIKEKDAEVSLTNSLENLQTAYNNLKSILSVAQNRPIEIADIPVASPETALDVNKIKDIAFQNSIEIKSALDSLNERKRAAKIAEHNLLPDLSVFVDYTRTGTDDGFNDDLLRLDEDTWRVYLTSSTDFSRTAEKNSYRQSLINVRSAELDLENKKDQLAKDVKNQIDFLEKTRERIAIIEKQINNAMGKLELSRIKFNNGMADNFDMIEAETELHRARLSLLSARINHIIGTYRLRKTIGTLIANN
ncbi:MAG: TolC family protein [Desulfobacterales bacterium]